ncbi:MAG TPA: hypothetical protein VGM83_19210 [Devosiaceae bacterium]|jgi:hypothetical protein
MLTAAAAPELFPHIRIVMGMVIGLGITRLLMGIAGFVQHPGRARLSGIHLLWAGSMLLEMIHFWWWEFALFTISNWTFGVFFFLIAYCILLFLLVALLFPDNISEYDGYEDFFMSRRKWFFGLFAVTFLFDIIDTEIKGSEHLAKFGFEYAIQIPVAIGLCLLAIWTPNRRIHYALVIGHLIYQASWIFRLFNTVN